MKAQSTKVKSAERVMDILELFKGENDSFSLSDIAKRLDMPASSTHQLLHNMLSRGYLESDSLGKQFSIGYKIFEISSICQKNTNLVTEFETIGGRMAEEVNEGIMLGIRAGNQLVYVAQKNPTDPRRFAIQFTQTLPLYASASGKMMLSGLSETVIRSLYPEEDLQPLTSQTITTVTALLAELETIRKEGISYNRGESVEGISCISAPIYNSVGSIIAAISVSIPDFRNTEEVWNRSLNCIREGALLLRG
ncbi:IclR family transcriptional regulator [Paenibacillus mendelii]|uniref:IclR family transcriptional regulator n=1 Tax=Paenibacillus mendelii TaxID=206163 RepID=A0ABV6J1U4_9BACL|nr:IclR family transcriptional regulator [Paenibacillus mendelii]MCQ6562777.1 IclR family transcriptional regulator [Paenibacillus mendelii]